MKIGYFADGVWSHKAIKRIISNKNFEICFIVPRYNSQDPILKSWADELEIDFLPLAKINSSSSLQTLEKYEADIFVSMSFDQIFKKEALLLPNLGTINCHAGALPFYRGRNVLNWVLINDESSFGVTVHYVDEGIDTGDIILQHLEPICEDDDYPSLLKKASFICSNLLYESLNDILNNRAKRIKQNHIDPVGSYFRKRVVGDENIDWNWNSRKIFNFVRSICSPGPCARAFVKNNEILINKVKISESLEGNYKEGEIINTNNDLYVKTVDGFLKLESYKSNNNFVLAGGDFFNK